MMASSPAILARDIPATSSIRRLRGAAGRDNERRRLAARSGYTAMQTAAHLPADGPRSAAICQRFGYRPRCAMMREGSMPRARLGLFLYGVDALGAAGDEFPRASLSLDAPPFETPKSEHYIRQRLLLPDDFRRLRRWVVPSFPYCLPA